MKGPNLQIAEFKQGLSSLINSSPLPFGAKQMILKEALDQVTSFNAQYIEAERQAYEKEKEEVNEDGEEIHKA